MDTWARQLDSQVSGLIAHVSLVQCWHQFFYGSYTTLHQSYVYRLALGLTLVVWRHFTYISETIKGILVNHTSIER